ncbi:hypothetical protein K0A96_02465 [Patescibacteria group bacterium]|nr:hypothetical protein [Patescibacteria group bacterium]
MKTKKNNISKNVIDRYRYVNDLMIFWSSLDVNDVLIFYVNDVLIFITYALTPINEDDIYFSAEMVKKIKQSAEQAKNGEVKRITSSEEINDLLGL